jgi:two-component system sensor histidine kinase UhpB
VRLQRRDGGVELTVTDVGRGFAFAESERGLGLAGMRERALLVGGELTIESGPGRGTTVRLRID